jgi:hypothetical protein
MTQIYPDGTVSSRHANGVAVNQRRASPAILPRSCEGGAPPLVKGTVESAPYRGGRKCHDSDGAWITTGPRPRLGGVASAPWV